MKSIMRGFLLLGALVYQSHLYAAIPPPPDEEPQHPTPEHSDSWSPESVIDLPTGRPTTDETSSNYPNEHWYKDMHKQLYQLQQYAYEVKYSAYSKELTEYADYLYVVVEKVYYATYDSYGQPISYEWGYPTRGDFNFYYYYWVRPLYKKILKYGYDYYSYAPPSKHYAYQKNMKPLYSGYHSLTRCMFGADGNDMNAEDDTDLADFEKAAGL